jgi:hypothetical protein
MRFSLYRLCVIFTVVVTLVAGMQFVIGMLMIPMVFLTAIFGIGLIGASCFYLLTNRAKVGFRSLAIVLTVAGVVIFSPIEKVGIYAKFWPSRLFYADQIDQILKTGTASCVQTKVCLVELRSQVKVAFPWDGLIDNWFGIVYDPSGSVFRVEDRSVFGGDLVACTHVAGPYYFCSFT